tara:strand:- start:239 stop:637 length:399 start_codon:yes stop_codon:yes gene_type:complete
MGCAPSPKIYTDAVSFERLPHVHLMGGPAHNRFNSGHELSRAERFGQVVVGPQFKTQHPIDFVITGRAKHNWRPIIGRTKLATNLSAIDFGQSNIENYQIKVFILCGSKARFSVVAGLNLESLTREVHADEI